MSITNGDFEVQKTGGGPGEAEGWSVVEVYTGEEYAEFTLSVADAVTRGQETFEGEWPAGFDSGLFGAFVGYYVDLDLAYFDQPAGLPREDFEELWGTGNQGPLSFESLPAEAAVFNSAEPSGPQTVEDMEHGWPAGQAVIPAFTPAMLSAATFAPGAKTHEDFEEQWRGNESYTWAFAGFGTDLQEAWFYIGYLSMSSYDGFEGEYFDITPVTFDPATDTWTKTSHGLSNNWQVTLANSGGRLPDGFLLATEYVVRNKTTDTFQLSATAAGPIVDGTDSGYGTHRAKHDTQFFWTEELTGV